MMIRWNDHDRPSATFDALRRQMDRLFDEYDHPSLFSAAPAGSLPLAFFDSGSALLLTAEVPGLTEKDFTLSLAQNVLTVQGERKVRAPEGYAVHRQERAGVRFSRSFALPCRVDPERTTATLKEGVLTITLPKTTEAQPRTIAVSAGLTKNPEISARDTMNDQSKARQGEAKNKGEERRRTAAPAVDVYESREDFLLVADLPGVKQEDLTVRLDQGELRFEGLRRAQAHGSLLAGSDGELVYRRTFTVPGGIDADKIEARLAGGVLQLRLPKAQAFKPRQITVSAG